MTDEQDVPLEPEERHLLAAGVREWSGPARCPRGLASALGFDGPGDLLSWLPVAETSLRDRASMSAQDWLRCLVLTEIAFSSDVFGSGTDWPTSTGLPDEETIRLLRRAQFRLGPVVAAARTSVDERTGSP